MAHGHNARRNHLKDWWGKRPLSGTGVSKNGMKAWKKILHGIERAKLKRQIDLDGE